jgi:hypothetical protein
VIMLNRTFTRILMMEVFSRVCSGVLWEMRESVVSDSGIRQWFFCWVGGIGNGKRSRHVPWSSSYVHCMSRLQTTQICVFNISHGTEDGVCTGGFGNSTVSFDTSLEVEVDDVPQDPSTDPHHGSTVVFGCIEVVCECYVSKIYRCILT